MAQQERVNRKYTQKQTKQEQAQAESLPSTHVDGDKVKAELDELLDEIDEVLEENAEEFVQGYVQKGGE